jgi:hypothetical protein
MPPGQLPVAVVSRPFLRCPGVPVSSCRRSARTAARPAPRPAARPVSSPGRRLAPSRAPVRQPARSDARPTVGPAPVASGPEASVVGECRPRAGKQTPRPASLVGREAGRPTAGLSRAQCTVPDRRALACRSARSRFAGPSRAAWRARGPGPPGPTSSWRRSTSSGRIDCKRAKLGRPGAGRCLRRRISTADPLFGPAGMGPAQSRGAPDLGYVTRRNLYIDQSQYSSAFANNLAISPTSG